MNNRLNYFLSSDNHPIYISEHARDVLDDKTIQFLIQGHVASLIVFNGNELIKNDSFDNNESYATIHGIIGFKVVLKTNIMEGYTYIDVLDEASDAQTE